MAEVASEKLKTGPIVLSNPRFAGVFYANWGQTSCFSPVFTIFLLFPLDDFKKDATFSRSYTGQRMAQVILNKEDYMAASSRMSKSAIASALAEKVGISKKQAVLFMEEQANLAYAQAKNGFVVPGLGKLELKQRKARMGRNPATGETIKIPAKKVVKFRVAKAAKDAILGNGVPKKAAKKAAPKKKAAKKR